MLKNFLYNLRISISFLAFLSSLGSHPVFGMEKDEEEESTFRRIIPEDTAEENMLLDLFPSKPYPLLKDRGIPKDYQDKLNPRSLGLHM